MKPFLGFSPRSSRNNVEYFKNMGKTYQDQHQIDENHYCSITFSKEMNEIRLIVLQNPCTTKENKHFGV